MKTSITFSRSGHYTVVIYDKFKRYFKATKIYGIENARQIAKVEKAKLEKGECDEN